MTRPPPRPAPPPGLADPLAGPLSLELLAHAPANVPPVPTGRSDPADMRAGPAATAPADMSGAPTPLVPSDMSFLTPADSPIVAVLPAGSTTPVPGDMPRAAAARSPGSPARPNISATPVPSDTSASPSPSDTSASPAPSDISALPDLWLVPPPRPPVPLAPPEALAELDALLARPDLDDPAIARLAALAPQVPGRLRAVVATLAAADSPAALAALLALPDAPGALPAACRLLQLGRTRRLSSGPDGLAPVCLALEFRPSRARPFPDLLRRAQRLAADPSGALRLDALRLGDRLRYRLSFWPAELEPRPRAALARAAAPDLVLLHARLARLRGARLWLSGFHFDDDGPVSPAAQAHLLRAWLAWSEGPVR